MAYSHSDHDAKAANMKSIKGTASSCWRRRTITSRIIPAIIQAFVAVSAWEALKSVLPSSNDQIDVLADSKNSRSLSQTNLPVIDTSEATSVSLLDLGSIIYAAEQPSHDRPVTFHLKTNIYVRNEKLNSLNLYQMGALVNFGPLRAKLAGDSGNCAQQNIGAGKRQTGGSVGVDIDTAAAKTDSHAGEVAQAETSAPGKKAGAYDYARASQPDAAPAGVIQAASAGSAKDKSAKFKPEGARPKSAASGNFQSQQDIIKDIFARKEELAKKQLEPGKIPVNVGKSLADPFHYMKILDTRLSQNLAATAAPSDDRNPVSDYNNQFGGLGKIEETDSSLPGRGIMIDETGEKLYADGFLERVSKLTSELFGGSVNKSIKPETPMTLLINSADPCRVLKDIDVVFLINSLPQNAVQRQRIRDTIVNAANFPDFHIVHVFLIGKITSPSYDQRLIQEQVVHQDIVQGDFIDEPDNATLKGLMGLRWAAQYCFNAKYIMKINEDVFVDTDKLVRGLIPAAKRISGKRVMLCYFNPESALTRTGPNSVREELFPGRTRLRPYCKSFAVLLTRGAVASILAASEYVRPVYLDDIYLFGVLPFVAGSVEIYDVGIKRAFHNFGMETLTCYTTQADKCPLVASVAFQDRFTNLWNFVQTRMKTPHPGWENERSLWNILDYRRKF